MFWGDKLDEWTAGIRQWYSIFYHGALLFLLLGFVVGGPPSLWKTISPHVFSEAFLKSHSWLPAIAIIGQFNPAAVRFEVIVEKIDGEISSSFHLPHGGQNEHQYCHRKKYSFHKFHG